jgi:hypothetical protein
MISQSDKLLDEVGPDYIKMKLKINLLWKRPEQHGLFGK